MVSKSRVTKTKVTEFDREAPNTMSISYRRTPTGGTEVRRVVVVSLDVQNLVCRSPRAVAPEDATRRKEEAKHERHKRAEHEPVGVPEVRADAAVADMVARNAEEHHLDNPSDECDEHGECADERHEDRPRAVVRCAAQAAEEGDA